MNSLKPSNKQKRGKTPKIYFIDLFCGAGGFTTGVERARLFGKRLARVIACVNHDPKAIQSHKANHRNVWHFVEDIRTLDVGPLAAMVKSYRKREPDCIIILHASLECTHYARCRGGLSKNADSRTLYEHLYRYVEALQPDGITIENVTEFRTAGPLRAKCTKQSSTMSTLAVDKNGKLVMIPNKEYSGEGFREWVDQMCAYGYHYEDRDLNAADFGAHTKRVRYFGQFMRYGLPISWPEPTHAKKPAPGSGLKKWNAVKEVINFSIEGKSIFGRKKKLVNKTLNRIYNGLIKYVAGGKEAFAEQKARYYQLHSFDGKYFPLNCGTAPKANENAFIQKYFTSGGNTSSVSQPLGAITTRDRDGLVCCVSSDYWLDKNYSGVYNHQSIEDPAGALTTKEHYALLEAKSFSFMDRQFSQGKRDESLNDPAGAILTVPKMNVISAEESPIKSSHFLFNPQFSSKGGSIHEPCFTLIARMDKAPPGIVSVHGVSVDANTGQVMDGLVIPVQESDTDIEILIKEFMAIYGLADIKNRMITVEELKLIQGFDIDYYLAGNKKDHTKFIGNSVAPVVAKALIGAIAKGLPRVVAMRSPKASQAQIMMEAA